MEPELVYVVKQMGGIGPHRNEEIVGIFRNKEQAQEIVEFQNKEYIIPREELFNIIPEDIYLKWPVDIDRDKDDNNPDEVINTWTGHANEFEGYSLTQYISQFVRCAIFAEDYKPCEIEEVYII